MNDIGSKQINLINEVKKYFIKLNISGIDVSKKVVLLHSKLWN